MKDIKEITLGEIIKTQEKIDESIKTIRKEFRKLHKRMKIQALLLDGYKTECGKKYSHNVAVELNIPASDVLKNHQNYIYSSHQAAVDAEILRRMDLVIRKVKK